jgi:hypothetical protein
MGIAYVYLDNKVNTGEVGGPSGGPYSRYPSAYTQAKATTDSYRTQAEAKLNAYRQTAAGAASAAESAIDAVRGFKFGNITLNLKGAEHVSPDYQTPGVGSVDFGSLSVGGQAASPTPSGLGGPAGGKGADPRPITGSVTISGMPGLTTTPSVPSAPSASNLSVSFPSTSITVPTTPGIPTAPTLSSFNISLAQPMTPEMLSVPDAGMAGLSNMATRLNMTMQGLAGTVIDFVVLNTLNTYIDRLLDGDVKPWMERTVPATLPGGFGGVPTMWAKRGMSAPSYQAQANQYAITRANQEEKYFADSNKAAFSVAAYNEVTDGIKLFPVVFAATQDLKIAQLDLDIRREILRAGVATLSLITAAAEAEAFVLEAKVKAANARALGSAAKAKAQGYKDVVQVAEAQVDMNKATARGYAAAQRAKRLQAQAYGSQVRAERAKMDGYLAQTSGEYDLLAAQAGYAGARIKGEVARYLGDISRMEGEYRADAAQASAVSARNRAAATIVAAQGEVIGAGAAKNSAESARVSAEIAAMESKLQNNAGAYLTNELANTISASKARAEMLKYQIGAITEGLIQEAESGRLEGQEQEFRSAARHFKALSESAMQTAKLCQQINVEAAEAESRLKVSVGQALAAVESGRLSGYRASISTEADYRASASLRAGLDVTESSNGTATQADSMVKEKEAV